MPSTGFRKGHDDSMTKAPASEGDESFEAPALIAEDAIVFPEMEVNITVRDSKNIAALAQAFKEKSLAVLVPVPGPEGLVGSVGTLAMVRAAQPSGKVGESFSRGLWRVRIQQVTQEQPYMRVRFTRAGGAESDSADKSTIMETVLQQIDEFGRLLPGVPVEIISFLKTIETPGRLADMCAYSPFLTLQERLDLLRTLDPNERLGKINKLFEKQLGDLKSAAKGDTIPECPMCIDLADKAFELGATKGAAVAEQFLEHVMREHKDELLAVLAEKYGPAFLSRRALR